MLLPMLLWGRTFWNILSGLIAEELLIDLNNVTLVIHGLPPDI